MLEMGLTCGARDPELRGVAVAAFFFRGALYRSTNTNIALRRLGCCLRACSSISVQSLRRIQFRRRRQRPSNLLFHCLGLINLSESRITEQPLFSSPRRSCLYIKKGKKGSPIGFLPFSYFHPYSNHVDTFRRRVKLSSSDKQHCRRPQERRCAFRSSH